MIPNLFCEQSEKAFIGCVVESEGGVLDTHRALPDHFTHFGCQVLFRAIQSLYEAKSPISIFTIRQKLTPEELNSLGGDFQLSEICSFPSVSMADYLFGILNQKLSLRRIFQVSKWAEAEIPNVKDTDEFCAEFHAKSSSFSPESEGENLLQSSLDKLEEKLDRMAAGKWEQGMRTQIAPWQTAFGGIMPGQMYALAGRPGTGKTAMMEMLIQDLMDYGNPVTIFEKDMSPQKLLERIACRAIGFPFWRFARGLVSTPAIHQIREAVKILRKVPLFVYSPAGLTADKMCAIARRDIRVNGVKAVFLDHIQTLKVGRDIREGLTQASLSIRANVTETNVPHIVLAHINREGAKGRPTPENIKEFDQLYGDCDAMAILWTEKSRADLAEGELLEVNFYVGKNRDGDITEDSLLFDGANLTFRNKAHVQAA